MTKLSYYLCTLQDDSQKLLYGTSKKEVSIVGEKLGVAPFKAIEEQNFVGNVKTNYSEQELTEVRKESKEKWDRKIKTVKKNKGQ